MRDGGGKQGHLGVVFIHFSETSCLHSLNRQDPGELDGITHSTGRDFHGLCKSRVYSKQIS